MKHPRGATAIAGSRYVMLKYPKVAKSRPKCWKIVRVLHADYAVYSNLTAFPGTQNLVLKYQRDVLALNPGQQVGNQLNRRVTDSRNSKSGVRLRRCLSQASAQYWEQGTRRQGVCIHGKR